MHQNYIISPNREEQFHRELKASLKSENDPTHWTESLPLVLLDIRTAYKSDVKCTAAELVYGTTLCLPGEFFAQIQGSHAQPSIADTTYVSRVKQAMHSLVATRRTHVMKHFPTARMFLYDSTPLKNHCSSHTMAHIACFHTQQSNIQSTTRATQPLFP